MRPRRKTFVYLPLCMLLLVTSCHGNQNEDTETYLSKFIADIWLEGGDMVRIIWRDCSKKLMEVKDVIDHKEYFPKFMRCMKRKTLRAIDRSLSPDVVPIAEGVSLVRFELVDRSGNILPENDTNSSWTEKELEENDWRTLALKRMVKILRTHVIKFDFEEGKSVEKFEFRGRRRHHMMTMMMFGVVSIGMVVVPMGFQFLAVLGGKALLLAKMALILASIQGLKKVAASPLNYGFYHTYPPYEHFEKRSRDDWPSPAVMPTTSSPSIIAQSPWSNPENGNIKADRVHIAKIPQEAKSSTKEVNWKPEIPKAVKKDSEPRLYPVYNGLAHSPTAVYSAIDAPAPLIDLTTRPGEVQADLALDLPFNNFRFQSPTPVVSA
ncbi:uncharacterized protein LOC110385501 isoform X2 [Bombyx mori]|uniref:Uncharacterized protein n=1 Tax=Bombyx mori TaxID=7091 RepID=A0A8R2LXI8_BOMMO|nr:uncharacterized protein LOC110385501 [Bombyx mori]